MVSPGGRTVTTPTSQVEGPGSLPGQGRDAEHVSIFHSFATPHQGVTSKKNIRTKANRLLQDRNRNSLPFDSRMTLTLK